MIPISKDSRAVTEALLKMAEESRSGKDSNSNEVSGITGLEEEGGGGGKTEMASAVKRLEEGPGT